MPRSTRRNHHGPFIAKIWLLAVGLLIASSLVVRAQSDPTTKPDDGSDIHNDGAGVLVEKENIAFEFQLVKEIESFADNADADQQFEHALYLPNMHMGTMVEASATVPTWRVVLNETFEGSFPTSGWAVADYNGSAVGTKVAASASLVWDDTSTKAYQGYWSAHPNDWSTYANHTDTWMRYGPMNLTGATKVRMSFYYWMDTETSYDIFGWSVSCGGDSAYRVGHQRSGPVRQWVKVSYELPDCANKSLVYLKFEFKSDYSNPSNPAPTGVWVDNIKVEKYQ